MAKLRTVDRIEITTLVDNVVDLVPDSPRPDALKAWQWVKGKRTKPTDVFAGHGLSLLVSTHIGNEFHHVIYDAGPSPRLLAHNVAVLGIQLRDVSEVLMSHGHDDHFGGLLWALKRIGHRDTPVYLHPRMFLKRGRLVKTEQGERIKEMGPIPTVDEVIRSGGRPLMDTQPRLLAGNTLIASGEIPRMTTFETGVPGHKAFVNGTWEDDENVIDDTFLLAVVRDRGLVVMTGCCHAGIVNTVKHAIKLAGSDRIHAIVGGMHLVGRDGQSRVVPSVEFLTGVHPSLIAPAHCTGWRAVRLLGQSIPDAVVNSGVGDRYTIACD